MISAESTVKPTRTRRLFEVTAFVAVWMVLGWALRLDPNAYLLLGIPLTVIFQVAVRREPLAAMWVRDAPRFAPVAWVIPVLAVLPVYQMLTIRAVRGAWSVLGWHVAALAGTVGAAYALRYATRVTWRELLRCLATAGTTGTLLMVVSRLARAEVPELSPHSAWMGVQWLLLYTAILFVLEEVTFRGVLDAHVHRPGERHGFASAVFVAALWGIWHVPTSTASGATLVGQAIAWLIVHTLLGVPLSYGWRRSGNLGVPVVVHALIDGVRNALLR